MATTITTATGLQDMDLDLTLDYELGNDIDCSGIANFEPVGGWNSQNAFTGSFDGKGYKLMSLTVNRAADDYIGLFGWTNGATFVKNVTLAGFTLTGDDNIGALIGYCQATPVSNITVTGVTTTGDDTTGGIIGTAYTTGTTAISNCPVTGAITCSTGNHVGGGIGALYGYDVSDCHSTANVSGGYITGGFVGYMNDGSILRCYATGTGACATDYLGGFIGQLVTGTVDRCYASGAMTCVDDIVGGFIGLHNAGVISDCYATGAVTGDDYVGGFAGQSDVVNRCYSTGLITHGGGAANVGGFTGNNADTMSRCFWDKTTSGEATGAGGGSSQTGVTGHLTADMKLVGTFSEAGWSISRIWNVLSGCNSGYPCLISVNECCSDAGTIKDESMAPSKVALEALRNLEVQFGGRIYVSKAGYFIYESRFTRGT